MLLLHPFSCWTSIFFSSVLTFVWYFLIFSFFVDVLIVFIHSSSFWQPLLWTLIRQVVYLCLIKVFLEIKGLPVCGPSMCPTCCGRVAAAVWVWVELSPSGWLGQATVATEISRALSEGHTQALADFQWSAKVAPSISKIGWISSPKWGFPERIHRFPASLTDTLRLVNEAPSLLF